MRKATLQVVLTLLLCATFACSAQTPCDIAYIKVAGMKPTQFGVARISLTKDLTQQIKRLYVSIPSYTISHFTLSISSMCGGGIRNMGAELNNYSLKIMHGLHSSETVFFDDVVISGPGGKCRKTFIIDVR